MKKIKAYAVLWMDHHRPWQMCKFSHTRCFAIFEKRGEAWAFARKCRESDPAACKQFGIRHKTVSIQIEKF
jgi:hypothetical protein